MRCHIITMPMNAISGHTMHKGATKDDPAFNNHQKSTMKVNIPEDIQKIMYDSKATEAAFERSGFPAFLPHGIH